MTEYVRTELHDKVAALMDALHIRADNSNSNYGFHLMHMGAAEPNRPVTWEFSTDGQTVVIGSGDDYYDVPLRVSDFEGFLK